MKLVLFDIDGTLLHCGGKTREPLARALEQTCGTAGSLLDDSFAGKTDDQIVFDALLSAGIEEERVGLVLPAIKRRYLEGLDAAFAGDAIELLPGVVETLDRLSAHESVRLGLLTGNWRVGARWKLDHFDLGPYFPVGAFGDGCRDRSSLPPIAVRAANQCFAQRFNRSDVVIVGDTPNDVRCGRENGIEVVAVCTGFSTAEELEAAGADWVFADLVEAEFLLPVLGSGGSSSVDS